MRPAASRAVTTNKDVHVGIDIGKDLSMSKTNTPSTLSILKSRFLLLVTLGMACLTMGCSQTNAMKERQITLQENVDITTEKTAALDAKLEQHQQHMDTALGAILKEQRILLSRQDGLQQSVTSLATQSEGLAGRVQTVSQKLSVLSTQIDEGQRLARANHENLAERLSSQQDGIHGLEQSHASLASSLAIVQSEQVSFAELADGNRKEIETLVLTSEARTQAGEELALLSDSRHDELQTISTRVDHGAATLTRIQESAQQLATNIQGMQTSHAQDKRLFLDRSEELLDRIKGLQADHSQWQERLSSLQQEIGRVRDSTTTLDDTIDPLDQVDQLEEAAAPE